MPSGRPGRVISRREACRRWERKQIAKGLCRHCSNKAIPGKKACAYHSEQRRLLQKRIYTEYKQKVFEHYGTECACCGEKNLLFLSLDHINNDGNVHRQAVYGKNGRGGLKMYKWLIANDFPDDIQILCYNCNIGKHLNGGICPHVS